MKRKQFLSSIISSTVSIPFLPVDHEQEVKGAITPKYLEPGDMIGITSSAGFISREDIQPAVQEMEKWGFKIKIGATIGKRDHNLGGSDDERARDFQQMLDDPFINAIMCARGGYGAVRIIDRLDFKNFLKHPKWIIGFSDATVLHSHISTNCGVASIHSKMCNSFPDDWRKADPIQQETILSIRKALTGEKMKYPITPNILNKPGIAEGPLIGGNLKTIETLAGTRSDINTAGKILFVEDTGEYLYSIDRMFWNLKRTGKLTNLKALIIGGFKIKLDDVGEEFGRSLYDIVLEKINEYHYPVCFNFPVGHQKDNFALKCGIRHHLEVSPVSTFLREI